MRFAGIIFLAVVFLAGAWAGKQWPQVNLVGKVIPNS